MKYPMIEKIGIETVYLNGATRINAADLELVLSEAPVVWFNDDKTMSPYWECSSRQDKQHDHSARLLCIEPIVQESEERKLLREVREGFVAGFRAGQASRDAEIERLRADQYLKGKLPSRMRCPDCSVESLFGNVHDEVCLKWQELTDQLTAEKQKVKALRDAILELGDSANEMWPDDLAAWSRRALAAYAKEKNG